MSQDDILTLKRGMASVRAGDLDGAISLFQRIGDGSGKCSSLARYYTAGCFLKQGHSIPAVSQFKKVRFEEDFKDQAEICELMYRMGAQFETAGLPERALDLYFRVLEKDINFRDVKSRIDTISSGVGKTPDEPDDPVVKGLPERYKIMSEIGRGGMGIVYRARDSVLDHEVALKVMSSTLAADGDCRERFLNEARAALRLTHPNIVRTHNAELADGIPFITMELVRGRTLRELIKEKGHLQLEEASKILDGAAAAIDHAHSAGIIHRDLKPDNIMVSDDGAVKVMDFGLAKAAELPSLTVAGASLGTPAYMSPEQVKGEIASRASDIYSLGVTVYEMLTGERPFQGRDTGYQHVHVQPRLPSEILPGLPEGVDAAVMAALQKNPGDRLSSAAELAGAIAGDSEIDLLATRISTPGREVFKSGRASPATIGLKEGLPTNPPVSRGRLPSVAIAAVVCLLILVVSRPGLRRAILQRVFSGRGKQVAASAPGVEAATPASAGLENQAFQDLFKGKTAFAGKSTTILYDFSDSGQARDFEIAAGPFHYFLSNWPASGSGFVSKLPLQTLVAPGVFTGDSAIRVRIETESDSGWIILGAGDGGNFRKLHYFVGSGKTVFFGSGSFKDSSPNLGEPLSGVQSIGGRPGVHYLGLEFRGGRFFFRDGSDSVQIPLDLPGLKDSIVFTVNYGGPVRLKTFEVTGTLEPGEWKHRLQKMGREGEAPPPHVLEKSVSAEERLDFVRNTPSPRAAAQTLLALISDETDYRKIQQLVRQYAVLTALVGDHSRYIPPLKETISAKVPESGEKLEKFAKRIISGIFTGAEVRFPEKRDGAGPARRRLRTAFQQRIKAGADRRPDLHDDDDAADDDLDGPVD